MTAPMTFDPNDPRRRTTAPANPFAQPVLNASVPEADRPGDPFPSSPDAPQAPDGGTTGRPPAPSPSTPNNPSIPSTPTGGPQNPAPNPSVPVTPPVTRPVGNQGLAAPPTPVAPGTPQWDQNLRTQVYGPGNSAATQAAQAATAGAFSATTPPATPMLCAGRWRPRSKKLGRRRTSAPSSRGRRRG